MGFFVLPAVPTVLGWLGGAAAGAAGVAGAHVIAPGREERERMLADAFSGANNDADTRAAPIATTNNCTECDSDDDCLVGEYKEIKEACSQRGGEAHHIVPDMVYRLGSRPTGEWQKNSTLNRAPNSPTFNQGMSVCLTPSQHRSGGADPNMGEGVHPALERSLASAGSGPPVPGTASMAIILRESLNALRDAGLPPECMTTAAIKTTGQLMSKTGPMAPGRTTRSLPIGNAYTVVSQGNYGRFNSTFGR